MTHKQVTLDLLQSIQYNAYHNEQRGSAEELREAHRYAEQASKSRQDGDESEQNRTRQGDATHDSIDILSRQTGSETLRREDRGE